jgi:hypothetical protein
MMEQYLDGPEVDVDLVLNSEGEVVFGNVTDNWPTIEPYFNETGSNCPSILGLAQQRELCALSVAAVKCMGFTVGAFHVECKFTSKNGAQLIEVDLPSLLACLHPPKALSCSRAGDHGWCTPLCSMGSIGPARCRCRVARALPAGACCRLSTSTALVLRSGHVLY